MSCSTSAACGWTWKSCRPGRAVERFSARSFPLFPALHSRDPIVAISLAMRLPTETEQGPEVAFGPHENKLLTWASRARACCTSQRPGFFTASLSDHRNMPRPTGSGQVATPPLRIRSAPDLELPSEGVAPISPVNQPARPGRRPSGSTGRSAVRRKPGGACDSQDKPAPPGGRSRNRDGLSDRSRPAIFGRPPGGAGWDA